MELGPCVTFSKAAIGAGLGYLELNQQIVWTKSNILEWTIKYGAINLGPNPLIAPCLSVTGKVLGGSLSFRHWKRIFQFSLSHVCICLSKHSLLLSHLVCLLNTIKLKKKAQSFFKVLEPRNKGKRSLLQSWLIILITCDASVEVTNMGDSFRTRGFASQFWWLYSYLKCLSLGNYLHEWDWEYQRYLFE
jgi:hypothetical protein